VTVRGGKKLMKFKELRNVCAETELIIHTPVNLLRHGHEQTPEEDVRGRLMLADFILLKAELRDHIGTLESILTVCKAVADGRYLEDWQQCTRWAGHCQGCTSPDACDGFDGREPHTVIASLLSELSPLSDVAREWIRYQGSYQRHRRDLLFGPEGLFGSAKIVMYQDDGSGILKPMGEVDAAAARAAHDAQEDATNESMASRVEQYDLNLERLAYLCRVKGDLQEIAAIIESGMPPHVRSPILGS
jgi:hypothetical protein